jgi:hypothetical protein
MDIDKSFWSVVASNGKSLVWDWDNLKWGDTKVEAGKRLSEVTKKAFGRSEYQFHTYEFWKECRVVEVVLKEVL